MKFSMALIAVFSAFALAHGPDGDEAMPMPMASKGVPAAKTTFATATKAVPTPPFAPVKASNLPKSKGKAPAGGMANMPGMGMSHSHGGARI